MMKIEIRESGDELVLQVEGRLAGPFVPELEKCWQKARAAHSGWTVSVDLKSVTCIDRSGRQLLELMSRAGVRFVHVGLAVQDILDQIAMPLTNAHPWEPGGCR